MAVTTGSRNTLATLTTSGRAAIAAAIAARPLHMAWGTGIADWDTADVTDLPSFVDRKELFNEIGRRLVSTVGFVEPDEQGGIVVPTAVQIDPETGERTTVLARYKQVTDPTPYLYVRVNYDFNDGMNQYIRELGLCMDTKTLEDLPQGQMYFKPSELTDKGFLLAAQILDAPKFRSPSERQTIEFVLPI